jgi:hypothetical protein
MILFKNWYESRAEAIIKTALVANEKALTRRAHNLHLDWWALAKQGGAMEFHGEGSLVTLETPHDFAEYEDNKFRKRGDVRRFTSRSRGRLMTRLATLKQSELPLFVTTTYGASWSPNPEDWKRDLNTLGVWLRWKYPDSSAIWKLEPQERGAPHYHLMIFGVHHFPWQILAVRWVEIVCKISLPTDYPVKSGREGAALFREWIDELDVDNATKDFLNAGTSVKRVLSRNGVMRYASKYMGKEIGKFEGVGRFWGVIGRKKLPVSKVHREAVAAVVLVYVRRVVRGFLRSKGIRWKCSGKTRIFTANPAKWVDVLEWAHDHYYERQRLLGNPF